MKALINCTCALPTATSSLGLFEEANAELEEIDPFCRHLPEVLGARLGIYHGLKKWELLAVVAKKLVEWNPKEPGFFVELAYATRRAESLRRKVRFLATRTCCFLRWWTKVTATQRYANRC